MNALSNMKDPPAVVLTAFVIAWRYHNDLIFLLVMIHLAIIIPVLTGISMSKTVKTSSFSKRAMGFWPHRRPHGPSSSTSSHEELAGHPQPHWSSATIYAPPFHVYWMIRCDWDRISKFHLKLRCLWYCVVLVQWLPPKKPQPSSSNSDNTGMITS